MVNRHRVGGILIGECVPENAPLQIQHTGDNMSEQNEENISYNEVKEMMRTHNMYECQDCQVEFMGKKFTNMLFCPICYSSSL